MSFLIKPVTSIYTELVKSRSQYASYSSICGYRKEFEDTHILSENYFHYILSGVFDGHGGSQCSKILASNLGPYLFEKQTNSILTPEIIITSCLELDSVCNFNSGSTATFSIAKKLENKKYKLFICNVGDSMTILLKQNNNYAPLFFTTEHKPNLETEKQRIEKSGSYVSNNRIDGQLSVSRAFGDIEFKNSDSPENHAVICIPEIAEFECDDGDVIIHICDGIIESNFTPHQVASYVKENIDKYGDLRILSSMICLEALQRGSNDNLSCMIVKLTNCEMNEYKKDLIPGPYVPENDYNFVKSYYKSTFDFGFRNVLKKRLRLIYDSETNYNYESEYEQLIYGHPVINDTINFEEEKKIIRQILDAIKEEQKSSCFC